MQTANAYAGSFKDPVLDAQAVFRVLMDCMARPGLVGTLPRLDAPPQPLSAAQAAIAMTLCDHDTPVHLSPALAAAGLARWLAFQTGARTVDDRDLARFAFIDRSEPFPSFSSFAAGSQDYPDRSATLVVEVPAVSGGPAQSLAGPGIRTNALLEARGLPAGFATAWAVNRKLFPRGIDLILTAGHKLVCLPRTVSIQPAGAP